MPITTKQRERRKTQQETAGSDLAAICGLDPYKSAYDVWLSRTGKIDHDRLEVAAARNKAIQCGNLLEDPILSWATPILGPMRRNQSRVNKAAMLRSSIDAILCLSSGPTDAPDNVEAKSSGMTWVLHEEWGDTMDDFPSDAIPQRIIPQAYAGMICTGAKRCWVPTLLGGRGFRMYAVDFQQGIANELIRRNLAFIHEHVETGVPPADSRPSIEFVKALRRQPDQVREVPAEMIETWREVKRKRLEFEKLEEQIKRDILVELEGCDGGTVDGELVVTNKMQTRKAYTVPESTFAVLREFNQKR